LSDIASKEANETYYWLTLCEKSNGYPYDARYQHLAEEIVNIISKIIITCKNRKAN
jgi:four helix bundle protein